MQGPCLLRAVEEEDVCVLAFLHLLISVQMDQHFGHHLKGWRQTGVDVAFVVLEVLAVWATFCLLRAPGLGVSFSDPSRKGARLRNAWNTWLEASSVSICQSSAMMQGGKNSCQLKYTGTLSLEVSLNQCLSHIFVGIRRDKLVVVENLSTSKT